MWRSIPSALISSIVIQVFKELIDYPIIIDFTEGLHRIRKRIKIKLFIFFILGLVVLMFFLYYLSLFCAIYYATQLTLIIGAVYSVAFLIVLNIVLCLFLAINRKAALICKSPCAYSVDLLIKNILRKYFHFK